MNDQWHIHTYLSNKIGEKAETSLLCLKETLFKEEDGYIVTQLTKLILVISKVEYSLWKKYIYRYVSICIKFISVSLKPLPYCILAKLKQTLS